MEIKNRVRTKDSEEASFLWTMDEHFSLDKVDTVENYGKPLIWFEFVTDYEAGDIEAIRNDYRLGRCLVEPRCYANKRTEIKNIVREKTSVFYNR